MASNQGNPPPPFTRFNDIYSPLAALLDQVKNAYSQGTAAVGTAYSTTHSSGSAAIADVVSSLSTTQIGFLNGPIAFRNPGNVDTSDTDNNNQTDIINEALTLFDASAAKYLKGQGSDGDNLRGPLQTGLQSYDTAIQVSGSM